MLIGQFYQLPYIYARLVADHGKFIGKSNLGVARRVLGQLAHLGRAGIGSVECSLHKSGIKFDCFPGRFRIDTTDHPVVVHQLVKRVSGQHPFGTIGYVQFIFQFRTFLIDDLRHPFGSKHRGGRLDDKQISLLKKRNYRTRRGLHIRDIRPVVLLERGRHYHKESIRLLGFRRCPEGAVANRFLHYFGQIGLHDMYPPLIDGIYHHRIYVYSNHLITVGCSNCRRRKANITQAQKQNFFHVKTYLI